MSRLSKGTLHFTLIIFRVTYRFACFDNFMSHVIGFDANTVMIMLGF